MICGGQSVCTNNKNNAKISDLASYATSRNCHTGSLQKTGALRISRITIVHREKMQNQHETMPCSSVQQDDTLSSGLCLAESVQRLRTCIQFNIVDTKLSFPDVVWARKCVGTSIAESEPAVWNCKTDTFWDSLFESIAAE